MRTTKFSKSCFYNALISLCKSCEYKDIQITQLCKKAGFNRSTFYRAYETKDDILIEKASELMNRYYEQCKNRGYTDYENIVSLFSFYRINGEVFSLMHKAHLDDELRKLSILNFPADTKHKDDEYKKVFIASGYLAVVLRWLENGMKESDEEMARCIWKLHN